VVVNRWCNTLHREGPGMQISFQLYSARSLPLPQALALVAKTGFEAVEGYRQLLADHPDLAVRLADHGLQMPTAHFPLPLLRRPDEALRLAQNLGLEQLFCPFVPEAERPTTRAGWAAFGVELAEFGALARAQGVRFGWHNHDFEFSALPDGTLPMEALLAETDLAWEMDLAWMVRAGVDPQGWIERYGTRINAVHVKDLAPEGTLLDEDGWADPGQGVLDWSALLATLKRFTACRYLVAEHDNPADVGRFARRAFDFLKSRTEVVD